MAAVTYGAHDAVKTAEPRAIKRTSIWLRFFEAVAEARMRQVRRELARHRHLLPADFEVGSKVNERSEDSLPFVR